MSDVGGRARGTPVRGQLLSLGRGFLLLGARRPVRIAASLTDADAVRAFVIGQLRARWAEFDRAVVVAAHRARMNLDEIAAIDNQVEMQTPCAELRSGSRRMGEAMLSVFARLGIGEAGAYRERVKQGDAFGHLAAMQGYLWGRAGLSEAECRRAFGAHLLDRAARRRHSGSAASAISRRSRS